jgi:hypothetical protein
VIPQFQEFNSHPPSLIQEDVGSLLYADDVVILSTSPTGLQNSLNKLSMYCKRWKLAVNLSKSKTMCFSKGGRGSQQQFTLGAELLENVKNFSYLGIEISCTGSFKLAQKCMTNKGLKALFKLKGLLRGSNLKPNVCLKLFDQLIKPICLYGAEVWGPDFIKAAMPIQEINTKFEVSMENLTCEKLNTSFAKFVLGVHRKAQNSAVRGELGRAPLGLDIVTTILKYYQRLQYGEVNQLLSEAFTISKADLGLDNKLWGSKCYKLQEYIKNYTCLDDSFLNRKNKKVVNKSLFIKYSEYWKSRIMSESNREPKISPAWSTSSI